MNIKKVASEAGVSITTVSRVMNTPEKVSESTRNKVLSVMKGLNYTPNYFARNIQTGRTNVIGLLIPDTLEQSYMELAKGVEKVAQQKQCSIIISNTDYDNTTEWNNIQTLTNRRIDGLILVSSALSINEMKRLHEKNVSFVLTDRTDLDGIENVVSTNYRDATREAVEHFIGMRRRNIAMIISQKALFVGNAKVAGYKEALQKHGMTFDPSMIIKSEDTIQGGLMACQQLLERKKRPDAIFCATDTMAFGAIERVRQLGLTVNDVGIIGYDDLKVGSVIEPKLTTVVKPAYRMGLTAARVLFDMIDDEELADEPQSIVLQSRLKIRKSCGNKNRVKEIW